MKSNANCSPTNYDRRPYRTQPVLTNGYSTEEFATPKTYRWWLTSAHLSFVEAHTQLYRLESPGEVMALMVDPNDRVGARVLSSFAYLGEPLPKRHQQADCGYVGPIVVIPCDVDHAVRVLAAFDPAVEYRLVKLAEGRTWLAVAASGGITVYDAPIEQRLGAHDMSNRPLAEVYEMTVKPEPVLIAVI